MAHSNKEDRFIPSSRSGQKIARTMYRPDGPESPTPAVVMCCGMGQVKAAGLSPFAPSFTSAGYATISFDNLWFGANERTPRAVLGAYAITLVPGKGSGRTWSA